MGEITKVRKFPREYFSLTCKSIDMGIFIVKKLGKNLGVK